MLSYEETLKRMSNAASVVKLVTGVANNAAWMVMLEGHDHARQCRNYRHGVKRNFKAAMQMMKDYEVRLLSNAYNRMFHLADMEPRVRKKYGNISDRQYYDFWCSMGATAYQKSKPIVTSLQNKYRLSLEKEGVADAMHVSWVMAAMACLELAVRMYDKAIKECVEGYELPKQVLEHVFGQFSLAAVSKAWRKALISLCPGTEEIEPDPVSKRNIDHGLYQLLETWVDPNLMYDSTMETVADYGEIFRTKGEQKKSLREIAEVRDETMNELKN